MNGLQRLFDTMATAEQATRSGYHVTLGKLISALSATNPNLLVLAVDEEGKQSAVSRFISYRGYYSDLALTPTDDAPLTVSALLMQAKAALGATFEGYKGGNYVMDERTPLWFADYGFSGSAIVGTHVGAAFLLLTKEID